MEAINKDSIRVRIIEIDGIFYYMTITNILYDGETYEEIGIWDAISRTIIYT